MKPLKILFFWHMHQPSYTVFDEPFHLPWTRLHATKDYYGMALLAGKSRDFRMSFNFSAVLMDQLKAYSNQAMDKELLITVREPASLTLEERMFLLNRMFSGNPISIINPFPRYSELFDQFGRGGEEAASRMTHRDINDLLVWRMLSWMHPDLQINNPVVKSLFEKESGFNEQDKSDLINETRKIINSIPGMYSSLADSQQISLTTTPYFHPILPLLLDSETARECHPGVTLPPAFNFKEDAQWHINSAINLCEQIFGQKPLGMWPAEGSVSMEAAELFAENGISWIASDEAILGRSMNVFFQRNSTGMLNRPDILYRPWKLATSKGEISILFRDHSLSDLIGFDYQSLPVDQAVDDFVFHLNTIQKRCQEYDHEPCVPIILDGENAWEHYENGGFDFLEALFTKIASEPGLYLENIDSFMAKTEEIQNLKYLSPGSWINGNFDIWIGQDEENRAWNAIRDYHDMLSETMAKHPDDCFDKALHMLRKSQASDTFWWFGDDHFTTEKGDFDKLFREILIKGYEYAGLIPPANLYRPIISFTIQDNSIKYPKNLISPVIDGKVKSYFDWFGSGIIDHKARSSAMHRSDQMTFFTKVLFGFDIQTLYLRFDPSKEFLESDDFNNFRVDLTFTEPVTGRDFSIEVKNRAASINFLGDTNTTGTCCLDDILEIGIPFVDLGIEPDERMSFHCEIWTHERLVYRIPGSSDIQFFAPTEDYDSLMWRV